MSYCKLLSPAVAALLILFVADDAYANACDVQKFASTNYGSLSEIQKLARLDAMSEKEYKKAVQDSGGSMGIGTFNLSGDHKTMKSEVREIKKLSKLDSFNSYKKHWNETGLNAVGLKAYTACLRSQQGFHLAAKSFNSKIATVTFIWSGGAAADVPKIHSFRNVTKNSMLEIRKQLGDQPLGKSPFLQDLLIERIDTKIPAIINFGLNNRSKVMYFPPILNILYPKNDNASRKCEPRIISAEHESYFSEYPTDTPVNLASKGVSVGGSGTIGSNTAVLKILEDCSATLTFSAGARSSSQKFPDRGSAPAIFMTLLDKMGNPLVEDGTDLLATIPSCGGANHFRDKPITRKNFITVERANKTFGFRLRLSKSSPVHC